MKNHQQDPVCGKRLNSNKAHIVITFEDIEYLLCCPRCQREFEQNPQKYIRQKLKKRRSNN